MRTRRPIPGTRRKPAENRLQLEIYKRPASGGALLFTSNSWTVCAMTGKPARTSSKRIAITGGIGAGKSTALEFFGQRGSAVLKTDEVVHQLLDREDLRVDVSRLLGLGDIPPGPEGRRLIAGKVFEDPIKLEALQELLFPLVRGLVISWFSGEAAAAPLAVVEVPMLFEAGMQELFDCVVLITAPEELRKKRLEKGVSSDQFESRAARQMPDSEKRPLCHYSYENAGSRADLEAFITGMMSDLMGPGS